jgi:hypothetical protein
MSDPRATQTTAERKAARRIPPLVWIIVAILLIWLIIALLQRGGTHTTPQGGTMPQQAEGTAVVPPSPAGGGAPATPGGTANGPNQGGANPAPQ